MIKYTLRKNYSESLNALFCDDFHLIEDEDRQDGNPLSKF